MAKAPLVLKVTDEPTYFNKEAAIGLPILFPIGLIVGAMMGKDRMEKERVNGRVIEEPTVFNKDMMLGGVIGSIGAAAVTVIGLAIAVFAGSMTGPAALAVVGIASSVASAMGMVTGGMIGGDYGKESMQQDYIQASLQAQEAELEVSKSPVVAHTPSHEHEHTKQHGPAIKEERARASATQHERV